MPVCKNCNARISKFDKDRCPVCGFPNPISTENSETVEITSNISLEKELKRGVKIKKKITVFLLSILLPFFGTPFYYLGYLKKGLIWLLINALFIGSVFSILFFLAFTNLDNKLLLSLIIPLSIAYLANIAVGIKYLIMNDYKDANGELVR
ncbi:MAG: hypothetical protein IJQ67_02860 [Bacilli bacterium]|nr:hypothetical protein [Bacilli bacterium]